MTNRYSLREQSPGRHTARWYDDAGQRRSKTFNTRTEAKDFLDNTRADLHRGDYVDPRNAKVPFKTIANDWLETKVKRPRTIAGYRSLLDNHILPNFGHRPVGSIGTRDVRKWLAQMQRTHKPGTVRNAYRVLKPALDAAVEDGCIKANPCGPLRRDDLPKSTRTEMLFLTAAQVAQVANHMPPIIAPADEDDISTTYSIMSAEGEGVSTKYPLAPASDHIRVSPKMVEVGSGAERPSPPSPSPQQMFVHFAAQTGMRFGEITALTLDNVDLLHRKITVNQSHSVVHGELITDRPKNGEERTIRISKVFAKQLRAYIDGQSLPAKGFVFPAPTGTQPNQYTNQPTSTTANHPNQPWRHTSAYPMFKAAARRAAKANPAILSPATADRLRIHDLRHTCAALLIAQNVPPKVIQQHLGHKSFAITMDRYGHLYPEAGDLVADAMDKVFALAP